MSKSSFSLANKFGSTSPYDQIRCHLKTHMTLICPSSTSKHKILSSIRVANFRSIFIDHNFRQQSTEQHDESSHNPHDQEQTHSSTHQQNHRKRYERKRHSYQNSQNSSRELHGQISALSHYKRLNIDSSADLNTIKTAYYSLSKLYHPDVADNAGSEEAAENFRLITESYDVLSDPDRRRQYDQDYNQSAGMELSKDRSWKPAGSNENHEAMFRMRDANLIFRQKQDALFEEEKRRNPEKFRAGSFKNLDKRKFNLSTERSRLSERIRQLEQTQVNLKREDSGSEFYRRHLYDTIQRRRSALDMEPNLHSQSGSMGVGPYVGLLGGFLLVICLCIGAIYDIDLARDMDSFLEERRRRAEAFASKDNQPQ